MYNLIFGPPLFYDIPEYLSIVSNHSFWQVFLLGHFPIHPIFLGILWILIRIFPVNVIAMLFGSLSIFLLYKISRLIFKGNTIIPSIIFALFPGVWLINTNLMVESVSLTFFLLSTYFFLLKKPLGFIVALFLMIGVHLEAIFWIPAIFLLPFIFQKEIGIGKKKIIKFIKFAVLSVLFSILFYLLLYAFSGRFPGGTTEQLTTYLSSGPLRMIRNAWLTFAAGFGVLTLPVLLFLLFRKVRSRIEALGWLIFLAEVFLIAANWQGDFMPRRTVFAGVILSLALYKYLKQKSFFVVLYLVPIVFANIVLYSGGSPFEFFNNLPKNQVLIQSHYYAPFTKYDGTVLWIGGDNLGKIDDYLREGKRVFLAKEAVTAPYLLVVGNNYHITSVGRVGDSESRFLFEKYEIDSYGGNFELKIFKGKVSDKAGNPVIYYDQSFWGRLARARVDYGDIGTWIWAVMTDHRDPIGWIYKDVRGK